jgi:hypothetical protein
MSWHAYRLVYRLESPLHVGWRKIGNLMQTRPYVAGRCWWGAVTSHLTQWLGVYDYQAVGEFVRENLIFGYFFPAEDTVRPLFPRWVSGDIRYGDELLPADEFERRFLSSLASTAIDYQHNTAAEGQLHEVEFVVPRTEKGDVFIIGHLLVREGDRIRSANSEVHVDELPLLTQVLAQVRIGGERRSGFGRLQLITDQIVQCNDIFGHALELDGERPVLRVNVANPLPAHFLVDGLDAEGEIEPLLGREWDEDTGPGRRLSIAMICWTPGSRTRQMGRAEIRPMSIGAMI